MKKTKLIIISASAIFILLIAVIVGIIGADESSSSYDNSSEFLMSTNNKIAVEYYSNNYRKILNSHLKGTTKGYVPLFRCIYLYNILMEQSDFCDGKDDCKPLNNYNENDDINVSKIIDNSSMGKYISNNNDDAVKFFKKAFNDSLNENGTLKSLEEVCKNDDYNSSKGCSKSFLNAVYKSGFESESGYPQVLNFPLKITNSISISSIFNVKRIVNLSSESFIDYHSGWDISAPAQTKIYSACDGVVTATNNSQKENKQSAIANYVKIKCDIKLNIQIEIWYWHLYPNSIVVSKNDHVSANQHIADVGTTGLSTGNHLHFQIVQVGHSNQRLDGFAYINWSKYNTSE